MKLYKINYIFKSFIPGQPGSKFYANIPAILNYDDCGHVTDSIDYIQSWLEYFYTTYKRMSAAVHHGTNVDIINRWAYNHKVFQ